MFQDATKIQKLPKFLRESVEELLYEREHSGVETTPDETSNTIEELYQYLGKLWICIFLHASTDPANKDRLQSHLFLFVYEQVEIIFNRNGTTIGNWIRMARYIRQIFLENQIPNPLKSLQDMDFGYFDQGDQRCNQLIAFRNEFAHGAFKADAKYIDQHFVILEEIFGELHDLYTRPIVYIQDAKVYDVETQNIIDVSFSVDSYKSDSTYVYLLCREEEMLIHLSPFFFFVDKNLTESKLGKIKVEALFYADLFASYIQRYTKEMEGNLDSNAQFAVRDEFEVDQNTLQEVSSICEKKSEQNIFLVEAYPGSHYKALGQELYKKPPTGFDAYIFWDIQLEDITQSSIALINKIVTVITEELKLKFDKPKDIKRRLSLSLQALQKQGKTIFLYINDLHVALQSYRQEEYRIVDILQFLVDSPVTVVATLHHGFLQKGLFYDVVFPYQHNTIDELELQKAVVDYVNTDLRKQIFSVLRHDKFMHLFDICDEIEAKSKKDAEDSETAVSIIFEPQVEYALWSCSALLTMKKEQRAKENGQGMEMIRLWSLAHPSIHTFL